MSCAVALLAAQAAGGQGLALASRLTVTPPAPSPSLGLLKGQSGWDSWLAVGWQAEWPSQADQESELILYTPPCEPRHASHRQVQMILPESMLRLNSVNVEGCALLKSQTGRGALRDFPV